VPGYRSIMPVSLTSEETNILSFKRAFWTIFVFILSIQIIDVLLLVKCGFETESLTNDYFTILNFTSLSWYVLFLTVVLFEMRKIYPRIAELFRIDVDIKHYLNVIKYFLLCAGAVVTLHYLEPGSELHLKLQSIQNTILTGLEVVLIAPIFEEIIFRGFLYKVMSHDFKREKERQIVNAMLFAAAHIFIFAFFLGADIPYYIFILGYFLAKLFEDSKSLIPSILLHFMNNAFVFLIELKALI